MLYLPENVILEIIRINAVIFSNNRNVHCTKTIFRYMEVHFIILCSEIIILLVWEPMIVRNATRWLSDPKPKLLPLSEVTKPQRKPLALF